MRELLAELTAALDQRRPCVYCAVVETRGSTPQKAGAAMLVFPDGGQRGTLGGGCVEAEVKQHALRVLHEGAASPRCFTFCLDDNYGWDDGLICGGRMTILADPLTVAYGRAETLDGVLPPLPHDWSKRAAAAPRRCVTGNPPGLAAGDRYLFDGAGEASSDSAAKRHCADEVARHLSPAARSDRARRFAQGIAYLPHPAARSPC